MANPYTNRGYMSRDGLSTRASSSSDEIQLRIDPIHDDLDDHITGLHKQITMLKTVAQEIETEAKFQNDFLSQLVCVRIFFTRGNREKKGGKLAEPEEEKQMTLVKAQAGVKNNMRRLNKSIIQQGSNHLCHVILFAFLCFMIFYFWSKFL